MQVGSFQLAYCTNVHPGEGLDALAGILDEVEAVKSAVCPDAPFGTGLRLGHAASAQLAGNPARLEGLAGRLADAGLYVFTVNGFPYGDFAAAVVKEAVYRPSWLDAARADYSMQLAEVMAALPGPATRSLSTVGGCFRGDAHDEAAFARMARHLDRAARGLADLADRTGVGVRLCLEPEPGTTLETTDDVLRFFGDHLLPLGEHARAHLGLCYDCCHQAVLFEDAADSIGRLVAAGVPIGKVQVSSALHLAQPSDPAARAALQAFAEPRYFHQTVARTRDGGRLRVLDLPALAEPGPEWLAAEAWRTHFHVPIWWAGSGPLGTTRADWQAALSAVAEHGACDHLEIETYTWHVIPEPERAALGALRTAVGAEFEAVQRHLSRVSG